MLLLGPALQGCAGLPHDAALLPASARPVELDATPFYPQARYQCGPAALATVLDAGGIDVEPDDLVERVYLPGRRGTIRAELLAATRTSGRVAYVLPPTLAALYAELEAGRPVLVLQNLGVAALPRWHYAVVVGVDPGKRQVVLRSGTERRRLTPVNTFLRTWQRGDFWAMVALAPGELPAVLDESRYLRAAADFEQVGTPADSLTAWRAAVTAFPGSTAARFGVANALYAAGELDAAERAYRALVAAGADQPAVRNNLAMTLAGLGRYDEAMAEVDRAFASAQLPAVVAELEATRETITGLMRDGAEAPVGHEGTKR